MARGARRGADDESVGVEGDDFALVDGDVHFDQAREGTLVDDRVVERQERVVFFPVAVQSDAKDGAFVDMVMAVDNLVEVVFNVLRL